MELQAENGMISVLHGHYLAVFGAGGDFQLLRNGCGVCRQGTSVEDCFIEIVKGKT